MTYSIDVLKVKKPVEIILDTETTGLDPAKNKLLSIQVLVEDKYYVFQEYNGETEVFRRDFRDLISQYNCVLVIHNAKFDLKFLISNKFIGYGDLNNRVIAIDTMILEQIRTSLQSDSYSLASVYKKYLSKTIDKSIRESFSNTNSIRPLSAKELEYAKNDVLILKELWDIMSKDGLNAVEYLETFVTPAFCMMELTGMMVDVDKWRTVTDDMKREHRELETALDIHALESDMGSLIKSMFGVSNGLFDDDTTLALRKLNFNWNSSKQVSELMSLMGIDVRDKEGKLSVSSKNLATLRRKNKFIASYLRYKELSTKIKAFGVKMLKLIRDDGRVHCEYRQIGAETGRVASRNPNLQNIPARDSYGKRFRECFVSPYGRRLIVADYSQAEIRIVAQFSKETKLIETLNANKDPYSEIATTMFNVPVSKTENKHLRDIAKSILLGLNYGMGAHKLAETIDCTIEEAKSHIQKFKKANPALIRFLTKCNDFGTRNRWIASGHPFRRIRVFDNKDFEPEQKFLAKVGRQSQNHPIQSTNADMTKLALVYIYERLRNFNNAYIINTVHDEILVECDEKDAEEIRGIVVSCMTKAGNLICPDVVMTSEGIVSNKWDK
jgi:DNA polymerase-1